MAVGHVWLERAGRLASKPVQIESKYETNAQFRRAEPDAPYQPPLAVLVGIGRKTCAHRRFGKATKMSGIGWDGTKR